MWRFRRFLEQLYNLWRWLPVIWRDKDWDYVYLLRLMQVKCKHMAELHEENRRHVGWERTVRELRIVAHLLDRLATDDYCDEEYLTHIAKWPRVSIGNHWPAATPLESCEFRRIMKREAILRRQDMDMLLNLLRRKMRTWWD